MKWKSVLFGLQLSLEYIFWVPQKQYESHTGLQWQGELNDNDLYIWVISSDFGINITTVMYDVKYAHDAEG